MRFQSIQPKHVSGKRIKEGGPSFRKKIKGIV